MQILNEDSQKVLATIEGLNGIDGIAATTTFCIQATADQTPAGTTAADTQSDLEQAQKEVAIWLFDSKNQDFLKRFSTLAIGPSSPFAGFNPSKTIRPDMARCKNATAKLVLMKEQFTHYMDVFESLQTYTSLKYPDTALTQVIIRNDKILKELFQTADMGMSQQAYGQLYEALCAGNNDISEGRIKDKPAVSLYKLGRLGNPSEEVKALTKEIAALEKAAAAGGAAEGEGAAKPSSPAGAELAKEAAHIEATFVANLAESEVDPAAKTAALATLAEVAEALAAKALEAEAEALAAEALEAEAEAALAIKTRVVVQKLQKG